MNLINIKAEFFLNWLMLLMTHHWCALTLKRWQKQSYKVSPAGRTLPWWWIIGVFGDAVCNKVDWLSQWVTERRKHPDRFLNLPTTTADVQLLCTRPTFMLWKVLLQLLWTRLQCNWWSAIQLFYILIAFLRINCRSINVDAEFCWSRFLPFSLSSFYHLTTLRLQNYVKHSL